MLTGVAIHSNMHHSLVLGAVTPSRCAVRRPCALN